MKIYRKVFSLTLFLVIPLLFFVSIRSVHASVVPTLSLTNTNTTSSQVNVYGDPNSSIQLHYGSSAGTIVTIGTTDQNGNFNTVISTDGYNVSCGQTAYVIVAGQTSQTISWVPNNSSCSTTSTTGNPSFSQNNIIVNVGQSQTITITGSGGYTISSNTNPGIISTNLSGNTLTINAVAFGGANVTVCESDSQCAVVSVVAVGANGQTNTSPIPALTSFTISSNNANGQFIGPASVITFSFNTNRTVTNPSIIVGTSVINISGTGSGPYTGTYIVPSNEPLPIPVAVNFTDLSGNIGRSAFGLGNTYASVATPAAVTTAAPTTVNGLPAGCTTTTAFSITTGQSCGNSITSAPTPAAAIIPTPLVTKYTFTKLLSMSTNSSDAEVGQLQKYLTSLGLYSGPVNSRFGPLTEAAVKKFQKSVGITQAGYVGPSTRDALNK